MCLVHGAVLRLLVRVGRGVTTSCVRARLVLGAGQASLFKKLLYAKTP